MSAFSNSTKLNKMINNIVEIHAVIAEVKGMLEKEILKEDIQMLIDAAKQEVRDSYQKYVADKDSNAND